MKDAIVAEAVFIGRVRSENSFAINSLGPKHLALAAARRKATIVHFGTEQVLDGSKGHGPSTKDVRKTRSINMVRKKFRRRRNQ